MNPSLAAYTRYISEESEEEVLIGPPPCGENSNLLETAQPIIQSEARIQSSNQKRGLWTISFETSLPIIQSEERIITITFEEFLNELVSMLVKVYKPQFIFSDEEQKMYLM